MGPVDRRVEDPEAARARGEDRLEADRPLRIAELARGSFDRCRAAHAPELGRGQPEPMQELVGLGLVVRALDRFERRDEDGNLLEDVERTRQPFEIEGRLRQHRRSSLAPGDVAGSPRETKGPIRRGTRWKAS